MTAWNPVYRVKVNGSTVTSATLSGLTVTSGRQDIYSQPNAGYCNLTLIETGETPVAFEINDRYTIFVHLVPCRLKYCGYGLVVECVLAKDETGVRFSLPALELSEAEVGKISKIKKNEKSRSF